MVTQGKHGMVTQKNTIKRMKTYTKHNTRNAVQEAKWLAINYFNNIGI